MNICKSKNLSTYPVHEKLFDASAPDFESRRATKIVEPDQAVNYNSASPGCSGKGLIVDPVSGGPRMT